MDLLGQREPTVPDQGAFEKVIKMKQQVIQKQAQFEQKKDKKKKNFVLV
jgi:hypothetical protein